MVEYFCGRPTLKMMSRQKLKLKIDYLFEAMKNQLVARFSNANYIALTADIWSSKHRSFMGVTAHWIDPVTYERQIATISCNRFTFPHTNERIAENLQIVCDSYEVREKIIATTTDNASNFLKAFREFGVTFERDFPEDQEWNKLNEEIEYIEVSTALSSHVKCGSHTFNLIAMKDAAAAQNDHKYFTQHKSAFTKLNRLWKCSSQPKAGEKIVEILSVNIHRPIVTRWNALFDCVLKILQIDILKLSEVMRELDIPELTPNDVHFLHEYIAVMKPIAKAIDTLQAERHCAYLLPVVHNTTKNLNKMNAKLKFSQPLLTAVLSGVGERFGYCYDFDDERCKAALIATCTHPYFKNRWITGESLRTTENLKKIRGFLLSAVAAIKSQTPLCNEYAVASPGKLYICETFTSYFQLPLIFIYQMCFPRVRQNKVLILILTIRRNTLWIR